MFALLQRNAMESPSATRLSPNTLSPPPGLLPTLPVASTPANNCAVLVKQEVSDQVAGFDESGLSPFKPIPTLENVKLESTEETKLKAVVPGLASGADSELLKQKLEMYWQGMLNYQQQLQQQQVYENGALNFPNLMKNGGSLVNEAPKSPDVLEKAKNVVQRLIEDDNKSKSKDFKMPWPSLAAIAANRRIRSPKNGQNNHISSLSPDGMKDSNLKQASMLSQQAYATMLSLQQMQQQHSTQPPAPLNLGNLLPPPPKTTVNGIGFLSTTSSKQESSVASDLSTTSLTTSTSLPFSGFSINLSSHTKGTSHSPTSGSNNDMKEKPDLDSPLDLSLSSSEKQKMPGCQPKPSPKPPTQTNKLPRLPPPLLRVSSRKDLNYASEVNQINLANTVNSQIYTSSPQQSAVEAHIKNSLSNNVLPSSGPFTSLYQTQETAGQMLRMALAAAGGKTLNELVQSGVPPIQIQQWLLTAMSAQKVQQMALNQLSMIQQQVNADPAPPKKRQKLTIDMTHRADLPMAQGSSQSGIFHQQNNMLLTNFSTQALAQQDNNLRPSQVSPQVNKKPKSSSPATGAENAQNQTGKRYRRYAKPPYSYVSLITLSILSSRDKKLRLSQILKRISEMFPFFNGSYQGWRDSVRHNLSQNECFVKVLKNPYRPTAKGNFWTVNLNSIPHELLLRQNTLVSRYAQDSGYRYRKDLSEVFDLRTGALKVPVPRQLIKDGDMQSPVLNDDPAAVMEAILLEETSDDEMSEYKEKVPPEVRSFTLEDLFNQTEDAEDDSLMSSGRGRRSKQTHHGNSHSQPPTLIPKSFASSLFASKPPFMSTDSAPTMVNNFQPSLHNRALESQNISLGMMSPALHPISSAQNEQPPLPLSTSPPQNPFASAQTALLSKAMATQLQGLTSFPVFQKMLYANQLVQNQAAHATQSVNASSTGRMKTPSPTHSSEGIGALSPAAVNSSMEELAKIQTNIASTMKRNKRKGVQPVRHATHEEYTQADESVETSVLSPHHSMSFLMSASTPSRAPSSEAESATTSSNNPFFSPILSSSSSKSHSSPHHNDSSELDDSSHNPVQSIFSISARDNIDASMAGFQALQRFNSQSLQAGKMA